MKEEKTTFERLIEPLEQSLTEIEAKRPIHHRESLTFSLFVKLLIYYFTQGIGSGRLLITDLGVTAPELKLPQVARSTFFEAFKRFPVEWFAILTSTLLEKLTWLEIPELKSLGKLYCVDGSLFPALARMTWAEYKTSCNALRLHLVFDLNHLLPVHIFVGSGNSNEKTVLKQLLETGVTYIADRGYVCFDLLADIVSQQADFVFRMKSNLSYCLLEEFQVTLPLSVSHFFCQVSDQKVSLKNATGHSPYRLISFWIDDEPFFLLTSRFDLTTFQVILIYGYRWQIELMFRFLKRSFNGLHLLTTSKPGITIQFYLLLIVALLQLHLKQSCALACDTLEMTDTAFDDISVADCFVSQHNHALFLATVGDKLHRFWKVGLHWLQTLRNLLTKPFNLAVVEALGRL